MSKCEFPKNTQEWIHWILQSRVLRTVKVEIETQDDEHFDYWDGEDDADDGDDDDDEAKKIHYRYGDDDDDGTGDDDDDEDEYSDIDSVAAGQRLPHYCCRCSSWWQPQIRNREGLFKEKSPFRSLFNSGESVPKS